MSAVLIGKPAIVGPVEIVRSFAYKLSTEPYGGNRFESRDFFCSQKAHCDAEDAQQVSALLYDFCKRVVLEDVRAYIRNIAQQRGKEI